MHVFCKWFPLVHSLCSIAHSYNLKCSNNVPQIPWVMLLMVYVFGQWYVYVSFGACLPTKVCILDSPLFPDYRSLHRSVTMCMYIHIWCNQIEVDMMVSQSVLSHYATQCCTFLCLQLRGRRTWMMGVGGWKRAKAVRNCILGFSSRLLRRLGILFGLCQMWKQVM